MHNIWAVVTLLGLIGWVGATLCLIFTSFGERGEFSRERARFFGTILILSYTVWITGMLNA